MARIAREKYLFSAAVSLRCGRNYKMLNCREKNKTKLLPHHIVHKLGAGQRPFVFTYLLFLILVLFFFSQTLQPDSECCSGLQRYYRNYENICGSLSNRRVRNNYTKLYRKRATHTFVCQLQLFTL